MSNIRTSISACEDWELGDDADPKPTSLLVQLRRQAYVFPWFRFVHAEGDNSEVTAVFVSHTLRIKGYGLTALLVGFSMQQLIRLVQPSENDAKFCARGGIPYDGPAITDISIALTE